MLRVAFQVLAVVLFPFALTVIAAPGLAFAETLAAWVELVGPGREASIRVIVSDNADCRIFNGWPSAVSVGGRANCLTKTAGQSRTADWGATT
jgi:hypothetical protein